MNYNQKLRARFVFFGILLAGLVLISALYFRQIILGHEYVSKANKQYVKPGSTVFDRGTIYFTSRSGGTTAAASVESGYTIAVNPMQIIDAELAYEAASQYLDLDEEEFIRKATKPNDQYEELASKVDQETANKILSLRVKGLGVVPQNWRIYPGREIASHTLGLIGEKPGSGVEGRYGLERVYQKTLSRAGIGSSMNVFAQLFSGIKGALGSNNAEGDIVTSIEPTVQTNLERILGEVNKTWKPAEIGAIIMDPNTGEIYAMASLPNFDANDLSDISDPSVFSNKLVEHVYEFGSIVKPLTVATGLDTGAITSVSTYNDTGTITLSGKKISNFDGKARGITDMQQVLSQSLNVGVAHIALEIGKEEFAKYFYSFGFGEKSGIDLPNEALGVTGNLKTGRDVEIATAAYGHGIATSPIVMTRGLSVLANGGYLITPHIVKTIKYKDGTEKDIAPVKSGPVLKKETTDEVTSMLVKVVDDALKKGALKNERYSIAAKTGTAQIADPKNGGYYTDRYLHSFFGYFPAYNPKFIVFLYQIHPKGAEYASETLAEPFGELSKFLLNYYNVPPDR